MSMRTLGRRLKFTFLRRRRRERLCRPVFERVEWALPRELGQYDFLAANRELIAHLATGKIKAGESLEGE